MDGCVLTEPSILWAWGIYDTDESFNTELIERVYICVSVWKYARM